MKEVTMQVILKVWSSNPDYSGGCDYAAVEISEELAKLTLRRVNITSEQRTLDPGLYEAYYWDSSAQYFSLWAVRPIELGELDEPDAGLEEMVDSLEVDAKEAVIAPPDFRVPEGQIVAVECAQMIVRDAGIAFTALLRHSDIYVTTAEIPRHIIESALAAAA
jgi:hypothetical protein